MKPWKMLEKEAARLFGGVRRVRVSFSDSVEDVLHHAYAIECKYGSQVPKGLVRDCVTILNQKYVLIPTQTKNDEWDSVHSQRIKFLEDAMNQAKGYSSFKRPIVIVKRPRQRGVTVICRIEDYQEVEDVIEREELLKKRPEDRVHRPNSRPPQGPVSGYEDDYWM